MGFRKDTAVSRAFLATLKTVFSLLVILFFCSSCVMGGSGGEEGSDGFAQEVEIVLEPEGAVLSSEPSVVPEQNGRRCGSLLETSPRGIACIHCSQSQAHTQAMVLADVALRSCVRNIAVNYLVDGTFGFDAEFLKNHISTLSQDGRRVFVVFYLTNGPAQRRWDTTRIVSFATKMSPEEFRERVLFDVSIQQEYLHRVERLLPVVIHARNLGAQVTLIPGLEDNLDDRAYQKLLDLTLSVLPSSLGVSLGRNPCSGCYPGNGSSIPPGIKEELHTASPGIWVRDGIVTNDGRDYNRLGSAGYGGASLTLDSLQSVLIEAGQANNAFILWNAERQGLIDVNQAFPLPQERNYVIPDEQEQQQIAEFLRVN